jgi:hypothetical protein
MRVRELVGMVTVGVLVLVACGDPGQQGTPEPSAGDEAHPFAVGEVAEHYELSVAGRGTYDQDWSSEMGADEPYVVIDVDGRTVAASVVPWEPMESSLQWASASGDREPETFVLDDGRPAAYGEGTDGGWSDLVIEVGPTEALRIATENGTREELVEMARHIDSDGDAAAAPTVDDPPTGWQVLGNVQPDALVALRSQVYPRATAAPGPPSAFSVGWLDQRLPEQNSSLSSLAVMVLPGEAADLEALAAPRPTYGGADVPSRMEVDGRPAVLFDGQAQFGGGLRSLVTNSETGALVVVTAYGEGLPTEQELVALAGSVRSIGEREWEEFEVEVFGGADLVADRGETELVRGEADGVEWLLQTSTFQPPPGTPEQSGVRVDECLKLSNRQWSCPSPRGGGADGSVFLWSSQEESFADIGLPEYLMVTTRVPDARRMRVTIGDTVVEADVEPVPGGSADTIGAGVAFVDLPEQTMLFPTTCLPAPPPAPDGMGPFRIDLLDGAGTTIGCVGD